MRLSTEKLILKEKTKIMNHDADIWNWGYQLKFHNYCLWFYLFMYVKNIKNIKNIIIMLN